MALSTEKVSFAGWTHDGNLLAEAVALEGWEHSVYINPVVGQRIWWKAS